MQAGFCARLRLGGLDLACDSAGDGAGSLDVARRLDLLAGEVGFGWQAFQNLQDSDDVSRLRATVGTALVNPGGPARHADRSYSAGNAHRRASSALEHPPWGNEA